MTGENVQPTAIKELVDRILEDGVISRKEQLLLTQAIAEDGRVTPDEIEQIDRIMDLLRAGKIKAIG